MTRLLEAVRESRLAPMADIRLNITVTDQGGAVSASIQEGMAGLGRVQRAGALTQKAPSRLS